MARGGPRFSDGWSNADVAVGAPKLFTFTRFPKSQWKSIRTSNAIVLPPERVEGDGNRREVVLGLAGVRAGQITVAQIDG